MHRYLASVLLLLVAVSACSSRRGAARSDVEATTGATPTSPQSVQIETSTPEGAQPTQAEIASPTSLPPTAPSPFDVESIGPGEEMAFAFQSSSGEEIRYWLSVPEGYDESRSWPLILSLHGFLGFEPSLERVREQSPPAFVESPAEFPFVVVSPMGPDGPWEIYHQPIEELIAQLGASVALDPEVVFLTGLSTGAAGAWRWGLASPDRFAGLVLVAGPPSSPQFPLDPEETCLLRDVPIWIGHSEVDSFAPIEPSRAAVMALEDCGSTMVTFSVYPDLTHEKTFAAAFGGPELYDWMLALAE